MRCQTIAGEVTEVNGKFLTFRTHDGNSIELLIEELILKLRSFRGDPKELVFAGTIKLGIYTGTRGVYSINFAQLE